MSDTSKPTAGASSKHRLVRRIAGAIYWSINVVSAVCLLVAVAVIGWPVWTALGDSKELRELAWLAALTIGVIKWLELIAALHAWSNEARRLQSPNAPASATPNMEDSHGS